MPKGSIVQPWNGVGGQVHLGQLGRRFEQVDAHRGDAVSGEVEALEGRKAKSRLGDGMKAVATQIEAFQVGKSTQDVGMNHMQMVVAKVQVNQAEDGGIYGLGQVPRWEEFD